MLISDQEAALLGKNRVDEELEVLVCPQDGADVEGLGQLNLRRLEKKLLVQLCVCLVSLLTRAAA